MFSCFYLIIIIITMKKHTLLSSILFVMVALCFFSCLDKLPTPNTSTCSTTITYNNHVKGILDRTCNISGCHDDLQEASFGTYASINSTRQTNIYNRVCVSKDMPVGGTTTAIIDTINCWKESGYLE